MAQLTEKFIKEDVKTDGKHPDSSVSGLCFIVKGGKGRFALKYRNLAGSQREYTIAAVEAMKLADVRNTAINLKQAIGEGADLQAERQARRQVTKNGYADSD